MRCAVLGDPIEHSLSPVLHRAGYAAAGLSWEYEPCRVPAGGLRAFLGGLGDDWRGLSLTMPLKREALDLLDDRPGSATETVWRSGAANTLILDGAAVHADNTDVPGAVAALGERNLRRLGGATILGGGATATSVGLALAGIGVRDVSLLVRTPERAGETVDRLGAAGLRVRVGDLATDAVRGDLVVSTIPVVGPDRRPGRPLRRRPRRVRGRLRPVAQPAGRRCARRTGGCSSPASTCSCTRRRCSSWRSPGCPRRWRRCGRPGSARWRLGRADGERRCRRWSPRCSAAPPASGSRRSSPGSPSPTNLPTTRSPTPRSPHGPGLTWKAAAGLARRGRPDRGRARLGVAAGLPAPPGARRGRARGRRLAHAAAAHQGDPADVRAGRRRRAGVLAGHPRHRRPGAGRVGLRGLVRAVLADVADLLARHGVRRRPAQRRARHRPGPARLG